MTENKREGESLSQEKAKIRAARLLILKIYAWVLGIGGSYYLWLRLTGLGIPCAFHEVTGLSCPGCGVSRMCLSLLRLDFASAFRFNPCIFVLGIFWNVIALFAFVGKPKFFRNGKFLFVLQISTAAILTLFGILRNFF